MHVIREWPKKRRIISGTEIEVLLVFFKFEVLFLLVVGIKRLEFAISDHVDHLLALSLLFIV